jgi:hypothetical protein
MTTLPGGASAGRAPVGWGGVVGVGTLGPGAGEEAGKGGGGGEEGGGPGWAPADERSFEANDETRSFDANAPPVASLLNVVPTQVLLLFFFCLGLRLNDSAVASLNVS